MYRVLLFISDHSSFYSALVINSTTASAFRSDMFWRLRCACLQRKYATPRFPCIGAEYDERNVLPDTSQQRNSRTPRRDYLDFCDRRNWQVVVYFNPNITASQAVSRIRRAAGLSLSKAIFRTIPIGHPFLGGGVEQVSCGVVFTGNWFQCSRVAELVHGDEAVEEPISVAIKRKRRWNICVVS